MIKNKVAFEKVVEGRSYILYCEVDSPLGALHDVLSAMKAEVVARIKAAEETEKPKEDKDG